MRRSGSVCPIVGYPPYMAVFWCLVGFFVACLGSRWLGSLACFLGCFGWGLIGDKRKRTMLAHDPLYSIPISVGDDCYIPPLIPGTL